MNTKPTHPPLVASSNARIRNGEIMQWEGLSA